MNPFLSVIIPIREEDAPLAEALRAAIGTHPDLEVLTVTGTQRGAQMNDGASRAAGRWLLFLHAVSRLAPGWDAALRTAPAGAVGGWFRFALDDAAWQARLIERGVAWRVRLLRLPYGDQGLFVRRDVFARLGGFRALPLLEDVDLVRRLRREGPLFEVPLPLLTSSRRWRHDGWLRRSARNLAIISAYFAGVSPARLARWYR
jgi:glycosyltransferase involved in cell wall biosynthesis